MKTFRKLHRRGVEEHSVAHFASILSEVRRILGKPAVPTAVASFSSQDDFARAYLSYNLTRKATRTSLMSNGEKLALDEVRDKIDYKHPCLSSIGCSGNAEISQQEATARIAFSTREVTNRHINQTFTWGYDSATGSFESDAIGDQTLIRARSIIKDILGPCDLTVVAKLASFGNGASASLKRTDAQREKKYLSGLTATRGLLEASQYFVASCPTWSSLCCPQGTTIYVNQAGLPSLPPYAVKTAGGAVLDFVPKDASTDRTIMKEPELNGYFQKGLGSLIRKRLRQYRINDKVMLDGIDLNTSGDLNSQLAQLGSEHGHMGTVDAKQASDSITIALAEFLLPDDWFAVVMNLRSPYVQTPWGKRRLEMVGGMGNGFTFELESVIFYAIGIAAAQRSAIPFAEYMVSIHGDDLVIPSDVYQYVSAAYESAGITINADKTFVTGPFRESCGGHYFSGHSVKPFYVKDQNGSLRGDWFWLANSLLLWLSERTEDFILSHRGRDLMELILHLRQYSSGGEPLTWSIGTEHARRSGLYGLSYLKLKRGFPFGRIITEVKADELLPDDGRYLAWLDHPTRVLSILEMCRHESATDNSAYTLVTKGRERERWTRHSSWTPLVLPKVTAPLWQLCRDHNILDF